MMNVILEEALYFDRYQPVSVSISLFPNIGKNINAFNVGMLYGLKEVERHCLECLEFP